MKFVFVNVADAFWHFCGVPEASEYIINIYRRKKIEDEYSVYFQRKKENIG